MQKNLVLGISFITVTTLLLFPIRISAHPGETDINGCHICENGCGAWGVPWGAQHCHDEEYGEEETSLDGFILPTTSPTPQPTVVIRESSYQLNSSNRPENEDTFSTWMLAIMGGLFVTILGAAWWNWKK